MRDRQHVLVDHEPREVNGAVGGSVNNIASRGNVDPTVSGRVGRGGSDKRPQNLMSSVDRPRPARLGGCSVIGSRRGRATADQTHGECTEKR
jgi:hypothetical protein